MPVGFLSGSNLSIALNAHFKTHLLKPPLDNRTECIGLQAFDNCNMDILSSNQPLFGHVSEFIVNFEGLFNEVPHLNTKPRCFWVVSSL